MKTYTKEKFLEYYSNDMLNILEEKNFWFHEGEAEYYWLCSCVETFSKIDRDLINGCFAYEKCSNCTGKGIAPIPAMELGMK